MKNKILILSSVLCLGIAISYIAFGWSEPTSSMPSEYKTPINTSIEEQDVTEGKPVVANLNADKLDGYDSSDLLALLGGAAAFEIVEGTSCSAGAILIATYYSAKTCGWINVVCNTSGSYPSYQCNTGYINESCTTGSGWVQDVPTCLMRQLWFACSGGGGTSPCTSSGSVINETCYAVVTHVLCLTIDTPE